MSIGGGQALFGAGPDLKTKISELSVLCFSAIVIHRIGSPSNLFIINLFLTLMWIIM